MSQSTQSSRLKNSEIERFSACIKFLDTAQPDWAQQAMDPGTVSPNTAQAVLQCRLEAWKTAQPAQSFGAETWLRSLTGATVIHWCPLVPAIVPTGPNSRWQSLDTKVCQQRHWFGQPVPMSAASNSEYPYLILGLFARSALSLLSPASFFPFECPSLFSLHDNRSPDCQSFQRAINTVSNRIFTVAFAFPAAIHSTSHISP